MRSAFPTKRSRTFEVRSRDGGVPQSSTGERALLVVWSLYALVLCACYEFSVDLWGYQGFKNTPNALKALFGVAVAGAFVFLAPRARPVARVVAQLSLGLVLIPSLILFAYNDFAWKFALVTVLGVATLQVTSLLIPSRRFRFFEVSGAALVRMLTIVAALNLIGLIFYLGFSRVNFDLFRIYEFREDALSALPGYFGYLNAFSTRAAIPFIFILGLRDRNYGYVAISIVFSVGFFAFTANRLPLFQPLFLLAIYWALSRVKYDIWLAAGFLGLALAGLASFVLADGTTPKVGALAIYRAIFVPMFANWQYIDYFGTYGDHFYWAGSKVSFGLIEASESIPMINIIGAEYWSGQHVAANVGWIGSGFGHASLFGVLLYSVLFGGLVALADGYARVHGIRVACSLLALPIVLGLTTADFFTLFLSQGLGAGLVMIALLIPRSK